MLILPSLPPSYNAYPARMKVSFYPVKGIVGDAFTEDSSRLMTEISGSK